MSKLLVHVGYPKTATTLLQNQFFNKLSSVNYLGKTNDDYPQWLIDFAYADDHYFEEIASSLKEMISAQMDAKRLNIVSSEAFTRFGGVNFNTARRIKRLFPDACILLTIRNPLNVICSFFKHQVIYERSCLDYDQLIDFERSPLVHYKRKPIYLPDLFYNEVVDFYAKLFGDENVIVAKYEEYTADESVMCGLFEEHFSVGCDEVKGYLSIKMRCGPSAETISEKLASNIEAVLNGYDCCEISRDKISEYVRSRYTLGGALERKITDIARGNVSRYYTL